MKCILPDIRACGHFLQSSKQCWRSLWKTVCQRLNIQCTCAPVLQYSVFLHLAIKVETSAFKEFDFKVDRLEVFLQKHTDSVSSLSKSWYLLRELWIFSNGQVTVVRGFSVTWHVMIENMTEQTFIAQHTIHNHTQSIGVFSQVVVSRELLAAAIAEKECY